jgi:hypothetical protein
MNKHHRPTKTKKTVIHRADINAAFLAASLADLDKQETVFSLNDRKCSCWCLNLIHVYVAT